MVFSSTIFLFLFLPIVLIFYYNPVMKKRIVGKNIVLLLASLVFYAWGEPLYVFVMMISTAITWYLGIKLQKKKNKCTLVTGIFFHVSILFVLKYLTFVVTEVGKLLNFDTSAFHVALPIGISFYSFQLMSYLFDIYYNKAIAQKNPLWVGLYVSFFPQLIAGPIVRYQQVANQIKERKDNISQVTIGMQRFIYGLGKKVLLANYIGQIADAIFRNQGGYVLTAWLGAVSYTLQIYFDFSGYSDMAIGLGKMFGFEFPENFNYPYISKSVTEFWKRWHISLSSWFRDYVYIPLGGNRVSRVKWIRNLFIVWLLTGIWHGANWTFLLWGMIYFLVLLLEKLTGFPKRLGKLSYLYTAVVVIFAWVIFRAENVILAIKYIGTMMGIGANGFCDAVFQGWIKVSFPILLCALLGITPLFRKIIIFLKNKKLGWLEWVWFVLVYISTLSVIVSSGYNPFIYFNF